MAQVPVFRQAETLTGFQIISTTDMLTALALLVTVGYSGQIIAAVQGGVTTYSMQFMNTGQTSTDAEGIQTVLIGGWVVYSSVTLEAIAYTAAQFAAVFHT